MPTVVTKPSNASQVFIALVMLAAAVLAPALLASRAPGLDWIIVLALMLAFLGTIGSWISSRVTGVLINERNLMSLSRFQLVLWTVLLLSAYWTAALRRISSAGISDPLGIALAPELWALMGISTVSLVGSPLLATGKKTKNPTDVDKAIAPAVEKFKEPKDEIKNNRVGTLYANASIADAAFTDLFEGEEIGNTASVDMARVQMFFFTMIAAISYAVVLWRQFRTAPLEQLNALPVLGDGLLAVLGISHAGYLMNKSVDHTQVQQ